MGSWFCNLQIRKQEGVTKDAVLESLAEFMNNRGYLPAEKAAFDLKMNVDERGSFTELLKTDSCGQFSVNILKPGITKGQHWHHRKWEFFVVVSGVGRVEQRKIGSDEVLTFDVSGERIQAVHLLPGYAHNIINLSDTQDLVTVMWANELFDPNKPDTYCEKV